jgi:hypothetical protein
MRRARSAVTDPRIHFFMLTSRRESVTEGPRPRLGSSDAPTIVRTAPMDHTENAVFGPKAAFQLFRPTQLRGTVLVSPQGR